MTSDKRVIKTYVWYGDQCFFVSTITRDSSAMLAPGLYNETLVWEYDWDNREQKGLIHQAGCPKDSIFKHQEIVNLLYKTGKPEKEEQED